MNNGWQLEASFRDGTEYQQAGPYVILRDAIGEILTRDACNNYENGSYINRPLNNGNPSTNIERGYPIAR